MEKQIISIRKIKEDGFLEKQDEKKVKCGIRKEW